MRNLRRAIAALMVLSWIAAPAHAQENREWLSARRAEFETWQAHHANKPAEIWDTAEAPRMTVISPGEYLMGSPASETGRNNDEGPQHRVRIAYSLAVSTDPVTVGEFARFAAATKYKTDTHCEAYRHEEGKFPARSWRDPGFPQTDSHPVVCISWSDAQAYIAWLSKKTGRRYRLLSEAEYEYAARAGASTAYDWGDDIGTNRANCDGCGSAWDNRSTSPVGSFPTNAFGLRDMTGNVWGWTGDCWNETYVGAASNGSATTTGDCDKRVLRSGSWYFNPRYLRAASRYWVASRARFYDVGFRVARPL